jgi:hypothetical protein
MLCPWNGISSRAAILGVYRDRVNEHTLIGLKEHRQRVPRRSAITFTDNPVQG